MKSEYMKRSGEFRGFTLLELLIVIAIIAVLSVALILVINPAETLKKSRDAQRISDLATLKTALGLVLTASSTPYLGTVSGTDYCLNGNATAQIFYSYNGTTCHPTTVTAGADANGSFVAAGSDGKCVTTPSNIDGTGWLPVNFTWLPGGSPISNLPVDPVNTITNTGAVTGTDLVYRYACQSTGGTKPSNVFEVDATLESQAYTVTDPKPANDGGDSSTYYEVGTDLKLLPTSGI
ncbi:MAG TPA: type II secretion system protein [Candidatus Paceibacterota bacterium]